MARERPRVAWRWNAQAIWQGRLFGCPELVRVWFVVPGRAPRKMGRFESTLAANDVLPWGRP